MLSKVQEMRRIATRMHDMAVSLPFVNRRVLDADFELFLALDHEVEAELTHPTPAFLNILGLPTVPDDRLVDQEKADLLAMKEIQRAASSNEKVEFSWEKNQAKDYVTLILASPLFRGGELDRIIDLLYLSGFEGVFSRRDGVVRVSIDRGLREKSVELLDKHGIEVSGVEE